MHKANMHIRVTKCFPTFIMWMSRRHWPHGFEMVIAYTCAHIHALYNSVIHSLHVTAKLNISGFCGWPSGEIWHPNPAVRERIKRDKCERNCKITRVSLTPPCITAYGWERGCGWVTKQGRDGRGERMGEGGLWEMNGKEKWKEGGGAKRGGNIGCLDEGKVC